MSKLETLWFFAAPIGCFVVSLFFLWYYFFRFYPRHGNSEDLLYAIMGFIAGIIWFKALYKGYKLTKAEEKATSSLKTQQAAQPQQSSAAETPATRYWKKFMWIVVVLFALGLVIRYFLGVYSLQ